MTRDVAKNTCPECGRSHRSGSRAWLACKTRRELAHAVQCGLSRVICRAPERHDISYWTTGAGAPASQK